MHRLIGGPRRIEDLIRESLRAHQSEKKMNNIITTTIVRARRDKQLKKKLELGEVNEELV